MEKGIVPFENLLLFFLKKTNVYLLYCTNALHVPPTPPHPS